LPPEFENKIKKKKDVFLIGPTRLASSQPSQQVGIGGGKWGRGIQINKKRKELIRYKI